MCWSSFFSLIIFWRIFGWLVGRATYILGLIPLVSVRVYQVSYPQHLVVHRPYDPRIEMGLGLALSFGSGLMAILTIGTPFIAGFFFVLAIIILSILLSGHFHPLALFSRPNIPLLTAQSIRVYQITVSIEEIWQVAKALHFMQQVLAACPELILHIQADAASVQWWLIDPLQSLMPTVLKKIIYAHYPDCVVHIKQLQEIDRPHQRLQKTVFYRQSAPFALSLQSPTSISPLDVIKTLTGLMNDLHLGERLSLTLATGGIAHHAAFIGQQGITRSNIRLWQYFNRRGVNQALAQIADGRDRQLRDLDFDRRLVEPKLQSPLYFAALWVQAQAQDDFRCNHLLSLAHSYIRSISNRPHNSLVQASHMQSEGNSLVDDVLEMYRSWRLGDAPIPTLILNPDEMSLLWHLPHKEIRAARVERVKKLQHLSEVLGTIQNGIKLGKAPYHHEWVNARIRDEDRRDHCNIIGRNGTGKSTLMYQMARQDIAAGRGVALIDPHGSTVQMLLQTAIPPDRERDVVLIDLADMDFPVPLNPFAIGNSQEDVFRIVGIIERFFAGTEQAVQVSAYLRAAVTLLSQQEDITVKDFTYLLLDKEYRERLLLQCDDPDIRLYLHKQYHRASEGSKSRIADPILNRIRPFYSNPILYPMVCHPQGLDFRQLIDEQKIVLISLNVDSAKVPLQERHLLGTLLMSQLQMAGMSRPTGSKPYYIYVDEVHRFTTTSLDELFSEARKYGIIMTTAHQHLSQIKGNTRESILGNIGTLVSFRCSPDDASTLAAYTKPEFLDHHLLNLDNYTAAVKMKAYKMVQPAFTLRTENMPPLPHDVHERVRRIKQLSRQNYTPMKRADVLTWLRQRYDFDDDF